MCSHAFWCVHRSQCARWSDMNPVPLPSSAHTGEHLGNIMFHKEVMKVMEADFLNIHVRTQSATLLLCPSLI